jgi:hypothetical protein
MSHSSKGKLLMTKTKDETNTDLIIALKDLRVKILDQGIDVASNLLPAFDNVMAATKQITKKIEKIISVLNSKT